MKILKHINFLLPVWVAILFLVSCNVQEGEILIEPEDVKIRKYWVSTDFISCANENLPMNCKSGLSFPYFVLDSLKNIELNCTPNESCTKDILNNGTGFFFCVEGNEYALNGEIDTFGLEYLSIDTIRINDKLYISNVIWEEWGSKFFNRVCGDILMKKYRSKINNVYKKEIDNLLAFYDMHLKGKYIVLSTDGKRFDFVIEIREDSLFFYEYPKSDPLSKKWMDAIQNIKSDKAKEIHAFALD